jgi:hypothetical protein
MWQEWEREEVHTGDLVGFWWGDMIERGHVEGIVLYGRVILKWIVKKYGGMGWSNLFQDRERQGAVVSAVMNLRVPLKCWKFLDYLTIPYPLSKEYAPWFYGVS